MALTCPRCRRAIDYEGERPSFCAYCGQQLPGASSTLIEADMTVDYRDPTIATAQSYGPGPRLAHPETIAGYRLVRKIGQGGMGSVHEGVDSSSGRRVAVKLIAPEFTASETAIERFLQEARLASSIAHPRCVFVLAADQSDGWPYIVMELMPGTTLKDLVESQGPLPQSEAVRKIIDVIEGLEEAHKLGVIHRDVKPSNCFLDADGRVKVGDFGLSKSILEVDANLTRTGSFLGTPHYASPEQIKGEEIDARSDVYSVAATLFYLLTGKPPFQANDATVTLARIVSDDAPTVRSIRPEVWSALDQAVLRGLERDRRRRYRSLEEFREALLPFLPGRVALSRIGLRIAAYILDIAFTLAAISVVMMLLGFIGHGFAHWKEGGASDLVAADVVSAMTIIAYYFVNEVLGHATLGKRLMRLRLASVRRGGPTSWGEAIARLVVFSAIVVVPRRAFAIVLEETDFRFREVVSASAIVQVVAFFLLFCTARASNGYRGLHEILSKTAVISLPWTFRRRRPSRPLFDATGPALVVALPPGLPPSIGPFAIGGALVWTSGRRVLIGEDEGLGRPVWIALRPEGTSSVSPARRDVARIARPRWLSSGEVDGWCWDGFVAPTGRPLPDLVAVRGRLGWPLVRPILETLSAELEAACGEGTVPDGLALERVWVQADGRVVLLDGMFDPMAGPVAEVEGVDPQARTLELLREVAICGLSGRRSAGGDRSTPVGAPVPDHAIRPLERLCRLEAPYKTVAEFRAELDATRNAAPELTNIQKFGHAAYTLLSTTAKMWLIPALVVVYSIFLAYMQGATEVPIPSEAAFDRTIQIQTILWILLAILIREGVGGLIFGTSIARADGLRASRLRLAGREAALWLPLLAVDYLFGFFPLEGPWAPLRLFGTPIFGVALPFLCVAPALFRRGRYLHDWLARTAVVPN